MTRTIRGHGGTDGTRWLGREVGARGWRPTAAVTLLVGVLAVAAAAPASVTAGTDEPAKLSDLPLAAQAQISAVLGRDQSSYHAVPQAGGFRVENSKHGLTADFTPAAVRVRAGTASWGLSL
ncbi:MAG TPA: hypothetical protein VMR52_04700, partial [Dehalococcoidia bacterium]|nr:hypothetical protein [Dehalococcoidia bacterium]